MQLLLVHGTWGNLRAIIWWPLYGHVSFWKLLEKNSQSIYILWIFAFAPGLHSLLHRRISRRISIVQWNSVRWRDKIWPGCNIKCVDQVLHTSGLLGKTFSWQFKKESDRYLAFKHIEEDLLQSLLHPLHACRLKSFGQYVCPWISCKKCIPRDFEFICRVLKSIRWPTRWALMVNQLDKNQARWNFIHRSA